MNFPHVTALVHGSAASIESVRIRGLSRRAPDGAVQLLFREGSRFQTAQAWRNSCQRNPPDLLYVCNTAMPGAPFGVLRRWSHRTPFVLDTGDAVFEMARRSGIGAGLKLPLLWLVETLAQRQATAIVVRGTRHREYLQARGHRNVVLIRDGYAEQSIATPSAVDTLRRTLNLEGQFVVGLMGSLVYSPRLKICYGWDLLMALQRLRDLPVVAVVIGDGPGREWLEARARELGVSQQVRFCGRIPYADVPTYLRVIDVALSTQTNNLPGQVRTTGKLPEYMAAERFILASRVGEAALILPDLMLLDYEGDVDAHYPLRLAERIRLLQRQPQLLELRRSLPQTARELCSYEQLSQQWDRLIRSLAAKPNHQLAARPI